MFRTVKRAILFIRRIIGWGRGTCPECSSYYGHSPSCNLASREEILKAYMWCQGEFQERRKQAEAYQASLHLRIDELTKENRMRRKEVQSLNAKIRKMTNEKET